MTLYDRSALLYDAMYRGIGKDYPAESAEVAALVLRRRPDARTLLDVACGTGEHARLLATEHGFQVDGIDLSQPLSNRQQDEVHRALAENSVIFFRDSDVPKFVTSLRLRRSSANSRKNARRITIKACDTIETI